jgi:3-oxoacyl-[acyl-carrier-protein] synthase-3
MQSAIHIGYTGHGAYLPATVVTNEDLERIVDTSDEWIERRTGIRARRILDRGESILDMAVEAARRAMRDAGVGPKEIGDIRVAVNTWLRFPSLATQVQKALGALHASAADVSAGCAGFIYAVEEAYNKIFLEKVRYGRSLVSLVIGVDGLSHITDWTDRRTCVLLGDGAGAVVMREVEAGGIEAIHTHADGRYGDLLYSDFVLEEQLRSPRTKTFTNKRQGPRAYLHMDGPKTFAIAVKTMAREVETVIRKYNEAHRYGASGNGAGRPLALEDIGYVFPHQANLRIIEATAKKLGVSLDKVYTAGVVSYGNTSTASIPIGYAETRDRHNGSSGPCWEVDVAFGAGFASGALLRRVR